MLRKSRRLCSMGLLFICFLIPFGLISCGNQDTISTSATPNPTTNSTESNAGTTPVSTSAPVYRNFSVDPGGTYITQAGTLICQGDIDGPNFSHDSDPNTGEIVVSQQAGITLSFPEGGSCTQWATNLQGDTLKSIVDNRKASQKCQNNTQPCTGGIQEFDV